MAPRHCLSQCWLIINALLWLSLERNFTWNTQDIYPWCRFKIINLRLHPHLPMRWDHIDYLYFCSCWQRARQRVRLACYSTWRTFRLLWPKSANWTYRSSWLAACWTTLPWQWAAGRSPSMREQVRWSFHHFIAQRCHALGCRLSALHEGMGKIFMPILLLNNVAMAIGCRPADHPLYRNRQASYFHSFH